MPSAGAGMRGVCAVHPRAASADEARTVACQPDGLQGGTGSTNTGRSFVKKPQWDLLPCTATVPVAQGQIRCVFMQHHPANR
jgi:hypothetical protein